MGEASRRKWGKRGAAQVKTGLPKTWKGGGAELCTREYQRTQREKVRLLESRMTIAEVEKAREQFRLASR